MSTSSTEVPRSPMPQPAMWATWLLLGLGLCGHLYAAHAMGGSRVAYTHHVLGFFLILVITGGVIALLGRLFWRSHRTVTMLAIGAVQALLGLVVAFEQVRGATGG